MHSDTEKHFTALGVRYVRGVKPVVSSERIARFESSAHLQLPSEYREFLKQYGNTAFGKAVEYPFIDTRCPWASNGCGRISVFFGLDGTYDLDQEFSNHVDRVPSDMLPIGEDGGGNLICLAFAGPDTGAVFFWDRDGEPEPEEKDLRENDLFDRALLRGFPQLDARCEPLI
jgi:SMI1-KNR4 cell-wall